MDRSRKRLRSRQTSQMQTQMERADIGGGAEATAAPPPQTQTISTQEETQSQSHSTTAISSTTSTSTEPISETLIAPAVTAATSTLSHPASSTSSHTALADLSPSHSNAQESSNQYQSHSHNQSNKRLKTKKGTTFHPAVTVTAAAAAAAANTDASTNASSGTSSSDAAPISQSNIQVSFDRDRDREILLSPPLDQPNLPISATVPLPLPPPLPLPVPLPVIDPSIRGYRAHFYWDHYPATTHAHSMSTTAASTITPHISTTPYDSNHVPINAREQHSESDRNPDLHPSSTSLVPSIPLIFQHLLRILSAVEWDRLHTDILATLDKKLIRPITETEFQHLTPNEVESLTITQWGDTDLHDDHANDKNEPHRYLITACRKDHVRLLYGDRMHGVLPTLGLCPQLINVYHISAGKAILVGGYGQQNTENEKQNTKSYWTCSCHRERHEEEREELAVLDRGTQMPRQEQLRTDEETKAHNEMDATHLSRDGVPNADGDSTRSGIRQPVSLPLNITDSPNMDDHRTNRMSVMQMETDSDQSFNDRSDHHINQQYPSVSLIAAFPHTKAVTDADVTLDTEPEDSGVLTSNQHEMQAVVKKSEAQLDQWHHQHAETLALDRVLMSNDEHAHVHHRATETETEPEVEVEADSETSAMNLSEAAMGNPNTHNNLSHSHNEPVESYSNSIHGSSSNNNNNNNSQHQHSLVVRLQKRVSSLQRSVSTLNEQVRSVSSSAHTWETRYKGEKELNARLWQRVVNIQRQLRQMSRPLTQALASQGRL